MKKNKLYTVNRGNIYALAGQMGPSINSKNSFEFFGTNGLSGNALKGLQYANQQDSMMNAFNLGKNSGASSSGSGGLFSKGNWGQGGAGSAAAGAVLGMASGIGQSETNKRGLFDVMDPVHQLAGGRESGVGNALGDAGVGVFQAGVSTGNPWIMAAGAGLKIVGGLTNALWGTKEDKEKRAAADKSIGINQNFVSNADSFDAIKGPATLTDTNIFTGGLFSGGKARRQNEEYALNMANAFNWADRSIGNNVNNLKSDQLEDFLRGYHAYGGPLDMGSGALGLMQQNRYFDTIDKRSEAIAGKNNFNTAYTGGAKTFDFGGLKASFMDEFGTDPIAAAVRYSQGVERMQAEKEAAAAEAQREADYLATQQRLANLETQNQGLQALIAAQSMPTIEIAESSSTPSPAVRKPSGNSTWDYVEDQLRKSGKFNDIQIEGIKYNLQRESSIDPTAVGDGGQAIGLGQWHGSRQPKDRSLEGQTQHLIDTLSNFDGKEHWIGRGNYEGFLNARTPEEAHYWIARGYERPAQRIIDKVKRDSDMSLSRLKAFGGELGTNGTDWTNGLLYIDEGGTHEENPMEGVPMGVDAEGIPNLVEEGETVYNNYVFSDRMTVPDFMYKELGLGGAIKKKGKGMSFADASKKLAQESEQRPNDPISQAGLEASLSKLAEVQETERMRQQAEEYMGLESYACGGKMGKKYAKGGKKGNMFVGTGSKPNSLAPINLDTDQSFVRRLFGNTGFTRLMENVGNAVSDPLGYFAGDEIDNIMGNIANMTEPQMERFFSTPIGQSIAGVIAGMNENGTSSNAHQAGVNRWFQATGRMARPIQKAVVNAAKRSYQQSRQLARSQMRTPTGTNTVPASSAGRNFVQEAQNTVDARNLRIGEQWARNANRTPTVATESVVMGPNVKGARFSGRTTTTSRLNPKSPTGKAAMSRGAAPDPYAGLEGTLSMRTPIGSGNFGYLPWIAGAGAGAGALYGLSDYLSDNLENNNNIYSVPIVPSAQSTVTGQTTASNVDAANTPTVINRSSLGNYNPITAGINDPATLMAIADLPAQNTGRNAGIASGTRATTDRSSNRNYGGVHVDDIIAFDPEKAALEVAKTRKPANVPVIDEATRQRIAMDGFTPEVRPDDAANIRWATDALNGNIGEGYDPYPTWMRYAPVVGAGAMALTDALGLTNKPDYTYADKLEAAANGAAYAPNIDYKPIGDYMRYEPLDRMFQQNQLNAIARSADRTIMNSSLPTASKYAALLAANYNNQLSAGNLFRQAQEYNRGMYERTKDFNRKTNMFNSQMDLESAMANARYHQAAQQMGLSGLAQAAALRDSIDARTGAARAANLSNFFTSLGNIGRENFALNQINSDRSRQYGVYRNGVSEHKRSSKGKKGSRWFNV